MRQVALDAGVLEYDDSGGPGRTVLLCHGLLMDGSVWEAVLRHLDGGLRVVRPLLPVGSHRRPMHPDADLSWGGHVAILEELLDRLDLDDVVLVVSDLGYPLALAAAENPRIGALVVLPCEAFDNIPPGLPGKTVRLSAGIPGGIRGAALGLRVPGVARLPFTLGPMADHPIDRRLLHRWTAPALRSAQVRRDLVKYARAADLGDLAETCHRLHRFDRPAVVLWSRTDAMMPFAHGVALADLLPQGRLVAFDRGGTLLQLDHPERVAAEIGELARG